MVKRIMRAFKMNEISAVDHPAQAGAKMVLMKRNAAAIAKDMYSVSSFAGLLSSIGYLMRSSESEAEYEGDNSPVPAALRAWLRQGAGIFDAMQKEELSELLAVTTRKRAATANKEGGMSKGIFGIFKNLGKAKATLAESIVSIVEDDTLDPVAKAKAIGETTEQFTDHVDDVVEKTLASGNGAITSEDDQVSAALKKALGLADTATEGEVLALIEKNKTDAAAAAAAKATADAEAITKANAESEDLRKRLATIEGERKLDGFKKRATELGLPESHGEILMKARDGDAEAWAKIEATIKGLVAQADAGGVFKELGGVGGAGGASAKSEIDAKAAELRKASPRLTIEKARAAVLEDPANAELYKRYNEETRERPLNRVRAA